MANKIEELELINKVYNKKDYIIKESEQPDFIIKKKGEKKEFGVEVTKLYYSQSSAKLKIYPKYREKFLKEGIPRKDQGYLGIHQLYIQYEGQWVHIGDTIDQSFKSYDDYIDAIISTIEVKNKKIKNYQKLDYYELFIDDKEQYLQFKNMKEFQKMWQSKKLQEVYNKTPYKRIYFFTVIDGRQVMYMMGELLDGPLDLKQDMLEKQKEYFNKLFKSSKK